ncbi:MAG: malate synthase G, partial [Gammaproteobacteria bacterium]|nr:malate synthase G [Gammaproteobacteria bacterium]
MSNYAEVGNLRVDGALQALVQDEIAPGTGVDPAAFWKALEDIVTELGPRNAELLAKRDALQKQLDEWHGARRGQSVDVSEYRDFLTE